MATGAASGDSTPLSRRVMEAIGNARVRFWTCPIGHCREPLRETVRWSGNVATCMDCGMTSENTDLNRAHLAASREMRKQGGSSLRHLLAIGLAAAKNGS